VDLRASLDDLEKRKFLTLPAVRVVHIRYRRENPILLPGTKPRSSTHNHVIDWPTMQLISIQVDQQNCLMDQVPLMLQMRLKRK
jgi:hypothetical protein